MKTVLVTIQVDDVLLSDKGTVTLQNTSAEVQDPQPIVPTKIMLQAYKDLQRGLVDTDLHGERGVEEVLKKSKNNHKKK